MPDEFSKLLAAARAAANKSSTDASSALASDSYSEFWRYASSLTTRWSDALAAEPLDWALLGRLREEARLEKNRAGIWLHGCCNDIEHDYVALREASLRTLNPQRLD
jgi:hypothetical protein